MSRSITLTILASILVIVGACASPAPGTLPEDMSADDHRMHAAAHAAKAQEHQAKYDPGALEREPYEPDLMDQSLPYYPGSFYNPTEKHIKHAEEHRKHARQHRDAARALEEFEEAQCASFPAQTRGLCPLSLVDSVEDVDGGVALILSQGTSAQAVADHIRCHFAFARTRGFEAMDQCPVHLGDIDVHIEDEGRVHLTSGDESVTLEIRARSRAMLEGR